MRLGQVWEHVDGGHHLQDNQVLKVRTKTDLHCPTHESQLSHNSHHLGGIGMY
jgi:hypothetical protein